MSNNTPELSDVLLYDPGYLNPELPTGFWFCADPEDVLAVQINAGCLRASAGGGALSRHERFFLQFCYVLVVCGDPEKRAVMVRELRQRLPNVILLAVEDKGFCRCNSVRDLRATCGLRAVERMLLEAVEIPAYGLLDLADVSAPDVSKLDKVLFGISNLDRATGGAVMGELSVWTGKRGEGKSTLLDQFLLEAIDQGQPVCAYSGELPAWKFKYWASLQAAGPKNLQVRKDQLSGREIPHPTPFAQQMLDEWWRGRFLLYDIGTSTYHDAANILRVFRYAHRRYGAKVYLVDNLMTARFRGNDRDFYRAQSEFVAELASFAHDNNVHVHLVAHPRKTYRISDSDEVAGIGGQRLRPGEGGAGGRPAGFGAYDPQKPLFWGAGPEHWPELRTEKQAILQVGDGQPGQGVRLGAERASGSCGFAGGRRGPVPVSGRRACRWRSGGWS